MKKIFIRSPYFIEVNEALQFGSKVEFRFYNKGTTIPTDATYTLTKSIASATQLNNAYNLSNYAAEFIRPINPVNIAVPTEENVNTWCYVQVKRYTELTLGTYTLLDTETFVCLNGFTQYSDGYNYNTTDAFLPLLNTSIQKQVLNYSTSYINVFFEAGTYTTSYGSLVVSDATLYKLPITSSEETVEAITINAEQLCEPKYTPIVCNFINRFGGWEYLTFFKANTQSIEVSSSDYNLLPSSINYNVLQGQKGVFNKQGKRKIKCNTGWVNENYSQLIEDLMLSEIVLLDNKPALVKSQSMDIKTSLKDKNINYEIDFEFNYGLINNVI